MQRQNGKQLSKDPITINVDVDFGTTFFGTAFPGPTIIGQTQSQLLYSDENYPEIRQHLLNHVTGSEGSLYGALPALTVPTDIGNVDTVVVATPLLRALRSSALQLPTIRRKTKSGRRQK